MYLMNCSMASEMIFNLNMFLFKGLVLEGKERCKSLISEFYIMYH